MQLLDVWLHFLPLGGQVGGANTILGGPSAPAARASPRQPRLTPALSTSTRPLVAPSDALRRRCAHYCAAGSALPLSPRRLTPPPSPRWSAPRCIGTHNGHFHADEALAVAMLRELPQFASHTIVRSRAPAELAPCEVVVDVGAEYDHARMRYDHHQKTFSDTLSPLHKVKLSAAGLVFKHYGKEVIQAIAAGRGVEGVVLDKLFERVYESFVEHLDGIDNGIESADGAVNYKVTTHLPARVDKLNLRWHEEQSEEAENARFLAAVDLCGSELRDVVIGLLDDWLPARALVESAMRSRQAVHPSGAILKLDRACPWKSHCFSIEEETGSVGRCVTPGAPLSHHRQCAPPRLPPYPLLASSWLLPPHPALAVSGTCSLPTPGATGASWPCRARRAPSPRDTRFPRHGLGSVTARWTPRRG